MATANLRVEGTLTTDDYWCDYWGDYGQTCTFNYIKSQYEWETGYNGDSVTDVKVTIHSQGGLIDIGYQVYDFLTTLGKKITTIVQGDCMSAATIIFLAGSTRLIPRHGKLMIHLPEGKAQGNVNVFEAYTSELQTETQKLIDFYVRVTGQTQEVIAELLAASTELSAERAVELGFATGILEPIAARAFVPRTAATAPGSAPAAPASAPVTAAAKPTLSPIQTTRMSNKRGLMSTLIGAIINLATGADVTALALKLSDGRTLDVSAAGEAESVGDTVTIDGAAAADGDYTLENGTVITVKDGVITMIVESDTTEEVTNDGSTDTSGTEGTTSPTTNSGGGDSSDRIAQLEAELTTTRSERDTANARMEQISNRMSHFEKLMGQQESAPVTAPPGSGATPSQKTNNGGGGAESLEDRMKSIAGKYTSPKK
ncbi:ATP-dependent Clp protease proteolytic subunit [Fibrella sp. ES10-3-2-2]|nr:hypothetical protein A6C57_01165 [Fibrella sp. ES10-3-2-2]